MALDIADRFIPNQYDNDITPGVVSSFSRLLTNAVTQENGENTINVRHLLPLTGLRSLAERAFNPPTDNRLMRWYQRHIGYSSGVSLYNGKLAMTEPLQGSFPIPFDGTRIPLPLIQSRVIDPQSAIIGTVYARTSHNTFHSEDLATFFSTNDLMSAILCEDGTFYMLLKHPGRNVEHSGDVATTQRVEATIRYAQNRHSAIKARPREDVVRDVCSQLGADYYVGHVDIGTNTISQMNLQKVA